jgi:hypothetical protein
LKPDTPQTLVHRTNTTERLDAAVLSAADTCAATTTSDDANANNSSSNGCGWCHPRNITETEQKKKKKKKKKKTAFHTVSM